MKYKSILGDYSAAWDKRGSASGIVMSLITRKGAAWGRRGRGEVEITV